VHIIDFLDSLIPCEGATDKIRKNLIMAEISDTISRKLSAKYVFCVVDLQSFLSPD
jgi:hypothetical protein